MPLVRANKISAAKARSLILDLARYGDNRHNIPPTEPDAPIIAWFEENGCPFNDMVERIRDPKQPVPAVENLIESDFTIVTTGSGNTGITVNSPSTGQAAQVRGPGAISFSSYQSAFGAALKSLDRAVDDASYQDLMQALGSGFASLDGLIAERASEWSRANPTDPLTEPPFRRFDEKVIEWFPKMAKGSIYDRNRPEWSVLKNLRDIRDDFAIHPQDAVYSIDFKNMAKIINDFPRGIAETLFRFHVFFGKRVPSSVVRARYRPAISAP